MSIIRRRPQFSDDLLQIWVFIAKDNEHYADGFIRQLSHRFDLLANNRQLGSHRFPNYPTYRVFSFRSYLIVYEPLQDHRGIELIRLLHAARDYHRFFED